MKSMLEIINECLKDSNLETVTKAELRKKYLMKTGLTKLPKEDKELFTSAVNTAFLNHFSTKTKEPLDTKENGEETVESCSDDLTSGNIKEDVVTNQYAKSGDDIQMEHSSDSDEKCLLSFKNNAIEKPSSNIKKQRGKRALISSSEDETVEINSKRSRNLEKAKKSNSNPVTAVKSLKTGNSKIKHRLKKAFLESSDSEEEPLTTFQKKSNSFRGSHKSMSESDESENDSITISSDSEDRPLMKFQKSNDSIHSNEETKKIKLKTEINYSLDMKSINDSSGSEDEPLTKFQKSNSLHSNGRTKKIKLNEKMNSSLDMELKNDSSDSENELTKYRQCDSSHSDPFTNKSNNTSKSNGSASGTDDDYALPLSKKKSKLNESCISKNSSSESENELLAKYSKTVENSIDSDKESSTSLIEKSSLNGSLKSIKNMSDSEDEPLCNLNNKANDSSDSEEKQDEKIMIDKTRHHLKKPVIIKKKSKESLLKKKKFVDSDDDETNISNRNIEESFVKQKNSLSDSNDDEPFNKLSSEKSGKKRKSSGSSSSSFVDENKQSNKQNKSSKKKETNGSEKGKKHPSASENKIEHLKKYLRVAGIRISNYKKLFENCKSMKAKCEKLMSLLEKEGLKGRPTLEKCKKLRIKIETKREIAELDMSNILKVTGGRPKRLVCSDATNNKPEEEGSTPIKKFSRLKDIIDSEESD